jgi:hypothetical protein
VVQQIEAELKRRDVALALVNWLLNPDALNTETGLSDPVIEYGLRALLGEVKTKLDAIKASVDAVDISVDSLTLEADEINLSTDQVEALLSTIIGHVDGVEALLSTIDSKDFATQATLALLTGKIPDEEGIWEYYGGTVGTVTIGTKLGAGERVTGIAASVTAAGGSMRINGGDLIPIPFPPTGSSVVGADLSPRGNLVDPVIVFSGTASYMVEVVR